MEVFQVFAQDRVPHRVDFFMMQMREFNGVFALFPGPKKSAEVLRQSSARVPASLSSSELSCHQMAPARESDESGEDEAGDALSAAYVALRRLRQRWESGGEG